MDKLKKMVASNGRWQTYVNTVLVVVALLLLVMIGIMSYERRNASDSNVSIEMTTEGGANEVVDSNYW